MRPRAPGVRALSETVCFRIEAPVGECDRLVGALHDLGTLGIEERDAEQSRSLLIAYFPMHRSARAGVLALADPARGIRVRGPESVPDTDWEREWRRGLEPRQVGPLWIRPSWCPSRGGRGEPELLIDPERAFGSGEHASTRLALCLLLDTLQPGDAILDLGTGSGVLALAALRMGAGRAVGVDVDPVACASARANARRNRLAPALVCGTLAAIDPEARFDVAVANLLVERLRPWLARLSRHARRAVILSGFLEGERPELERAVAPLGLRASATKTESQSGQLWGGLLLTRSQSRSLQSSRRSRSVSSKESSALQPRRRSRAGSPTSASRSGGAGR